MNIETANRLLKYRKDNNLSQEALAQKLGISRQAVSKWERAEASPDTDNLVELAKIYNVSLDELVNGLDDNNETNDTNDSNADKEDTEEKEEYVSISAKGIHVKDKDGSEVHVGWNGIHIKDSSSNTDINPDYVWCNGKDYSHHHFSKNDFTYCEFPIGIIITIGYLAYAAFTGFWHPTWLVFLLIPIISTFVTAVKKRNANYFAYPVLTALIFLYYGFMESVWHPTWLVFVTIPLYYSLVGYFNARKKYRKERKEQQEKNVE